MWCFTKASICQLKLGLYTFLVQSGSALMNTYKPNFLNFRLLTSEVETNSWENTEEKGGVVECRIILKEAREDEAGKKKSLGIKRGKGRKRFLQRCKNLSPGRCEKGGRRVRVIRGTAGWKRWFVRRLPKSGNRVCVPLPNGTGSQARDWMVDSEPRAADLPMPQLFAGHGCFAEFLQRFGKESSDACWHCDLGVVSDTADHMIWSESLTRSSGVTCAWSIDASNSPGWSKGGVSGRQFLRNVMMLKRGLRGRGSGPRLSPAEKERR